MWCTTLVWTLQVYKAVRGGVAEVAVKVLSGGASAGDLDSVVEVCVAMLCPTAAGEASGESCPARTCPACKGGNESANSDQGARLPDAHVVNSVSSCLATRSGTLPHRGSDENGWQRPLMHIAAGTCADSAACRTTPWCCCCQRSRWTPERGESQSRCDALLRCQESITDPDQIGNHTLTFIFVFPLGRRWAS